eukprot:scaffold1353_cov363-Pavlova_lutheri.AAC.1
MFRNKFDFFTGTLPMDASIRALEIRLRTSNLRPEELPTLDLSKSQRPHFCQPTKEQSTALHPCSTPGAGLFAWTAPPPPDPPTNEDTGTP